MSFDRLMPLLLIGVLVALLLFAATQAKPEPLTLRWQNMDRVTSASHLRVCEGTKCQTIILAEWCGPTEACVTFIDWAPGFPMLTLESSLGGKDWSAKSEARQHVVYPDGWAFEESCKADVDGDGYVLGTDIAKGRENFNLVCLDPIPVR